MKNQVIIKSSPNGITVELDDKAKFADLLDETADKFKAGREFFRDASVALTFRGRPLSDAEEDALANVISENSDLSIVCICEVRPSANELHVRALETAKKILDKKASDEKKLSDAQYYRIHEGNVTDDTVLDCPHSLLVLGSVDKSSAVVSSGSIVVVGELSGMAVAGKGSSDGSPHFVAANELHPVKLEIDGVRKKFSLFGEKKTHGSRGAAKIAFVQDGKIEIEEDAGEVIKKLHV